jgi:hypothetical protein
MAQADGWDDVKYFPGGYRALGVSRRTWRRWQEGKARIPRAVVLLARLFVNGDLGALDPAWQGWILRRGKLWDTEHSNGWHTTGTIRAWWWTMQRLFEKPKREAEQIREQARAIMQADPVYREHYAKAIARLHAAADRQQVLPDAGRSGNIRPPSKSRRAAPTLHRRDQVAAT